MYFFFDATIVRLTMLLPNCLGVKLSSAKLLIFLSWCQIVRVPNCPVPNCLGEKLSGAKLSYHLMCSSIWTQAFFLQYAHDSKPMTNSKGKIKVFINWAEDHLNKVVFDSNATLRATITTDSELILAYILTIVRANLSGDLCYTWTQHDVASVLAHTWKITLKKSRTNVIDVTLLKRKQSLV